MPLKPIMEDFSKLLEIARQPVDSTNVSSIGFDSKHGIIVVEFWSGSIYGYLDCSEELFNEFVNSESKGQFIHRRLKNSKEAVKVYK